MCYNKFKGEKMDLDFTLGRRVKDSENNWQEFEIEDFTVTKPVILVFGGRGANSNKDTNGYLKVIESLIGVFNEDVDLVGVCYNDGTSTTNIQERNIARMVLNFFMPLISTNGRKKLSVEKACKNLRQVTIFAHCFGVQIVNEITERFMDEMNYIGYSYDEQLKILSNIFMIGYASWTKNSKFQSLNIISPYDTFFQNGKIVWEDVLFYLDEIDMSPEDKKELKEIYKKVSKNNDSSEIENFYKNKERCYVLKRNNISKHQSIDLVCSKINKGKLDHYFKGATRGPDWEPHNWATVTGDYISRCLSASFCFSIANSMFNGMTRKLIPFSMNGLQKHLEEVVKPLNEGKANKYSFKILNKD